MRRWWYAPTPAAIPEPKMAARSRLPRSRGVQCSIQAKRRLIGQSSHVIVWEGLYIAITRYVERGPRFDTIDVRLVTLAEYAVLPRPTLGWITHKILPKPGLVLLVGPPKAGKSFLALDIALRVARGQPILGQPTVPHPVLFLQLDTSETVWRDRLHQLREMGDDLAGNVLMPHPEDMPRGGIDILTASGRAFLTAALLQGNPGLVIVDILRELSHMDENDSTEMKAVGDAICDIMANRCVLLVHHTKKISRDEDPDPMIAGRGTGYIKGKVDAVWLLWHGRLKIVPRFDEPVTYRAEQTDTGMFTFPDLEGRKESAQRVLALCAEFPLVPHAQLFKIAQQRWGMSRASYYRYLAGRTCAHQAAAGPFPRTDGAPTSRL